MSLKQVWYTRCPAPTPLSLAWQLGWVQEFFGSHGIEVASIRDSADPAVRVSHFDHRLDFSFRQGGNIPPLWARASGRDTRVVGITTTDEFQAMIALPGGPAVAADLAGLRVGIPVNKDAVIDFQRATALKGLASALSLAGLSIGQVEIVALSSGDSTLSATDAAANLGLRRRLPYGVEIAALLRGQIDAFFVKGAEGLALANQIGAHVVAEFGFHPDPAIRVNNGTPRPLTVDGVFATERPDLVAGLVDTVARAGDWATANPDAALRFVAREIGASEDAVAVAMGPDLHKHLRLVTQPEQIAALDHFQKFLAEHGFIPKVFDIDGWVSPPARQVAA